jgi:predicted GH43/DUF377 family glycosyl hydrolase
MQPFYKLKTTRVVPPCGFIGIKPDGTEISRPSFRQLTNDLTFFLKNHTQQQIEQHIETETCRKLAQYGCFDLMDTFYPSLREQADVTFIPNESLLPAPHSYNPGLLWHSDRLWMCYRRHLENAFSEIALTQIDLDTLQPVGKQWTIQIPKEYENEDHEDARMIWHNGEICVSYTMWRRAVSPEGRWLYMPRIDVAMLNENFTFNRKFTPTFMGNGKIAEKNWTFFSHDKELLFCYDFENHIIGRIDSDCKCSQVAKIPGIKWGYGTIRGSTPPVRISDTEYLSFFHSRKNDPGPPHKIRYYAGAYCFEAKAPFRITRFTEQPLLVGSEKDQQWDGKLACVFPCGLVVRGDTAYVSAGSNDMECVIARFDVPEILANMTKHDT